MAVTYERVVFTDFLFKEAWLCKTKTQSTNIHIKNYLAWPIYKNESTAVISWKAKYRNIAEMIEEPPPTDVTSLISNIEEFIDSNTRENWYIWSRSLSNMRRIMIENCDVRILCRW